MVEAKNWSQPVGSQEVAYFATRLKHRGCDHGILVATAGITGVPAQITAAQYQISSALAEGRRILVVTRADIETFTDTSDIVYTLKKKLCSLIASGGALG